jgi:hypothetical protein
MLPFYVLRDLAYPTTGMNDNELNDEIPSKGKPAMRTEEGQVK